MILNKLKKMWPLSAFAKLFWGKPELNERLAMAHAQSLREHVLKRLHQAVQDSIEGLGAKDSQVKHCEKSLSFRTLACNAPNRRVVVDFKKSNTNTNAMYRFA